MPTLELQEYGTAEVMKRAGLSLRRLDYWIRIGLIRPSIAEATGSGSRRHWSAGDLRLIRLLAVLRREGTQVDCLWGVVEHLRDPTRLDRDVLIICDDEVWTGSFRYLAGFVQMNHKAYQLVGLAQFRED